MRRAAFSWASRQAIPALAAAVACVLSACSSPPRAAAPAEPLRATLDSIRVACHAPALAGAVVDHDGILVQVVCGVRRAGNTARIAPQDAFHIGSCTKAMTATLIALLVQDGTLRWDLTVAEALPEAAAGANPAFAHATLRQLLNHQAGIPSYTSVPDDSMRLLLALPGSPAAQRLAFVQHVLQEPAVFPKDESYEYSNAGYTIAACMAERATSKPWEELMRARLFEPLNLRTAGFGWPASPVHPRAPFGHELRAGDLVPIPVDAWYRLGPCLAPGGDVHASIADLARFAQFHLSQGASHPGLLAGEAFETLHAPPGGASAGYAMGWQLVHTPAGEAVLMHDGTAGSFYCRVVLFPARDRAVVVAANAGEPAGEQACVAAVGPLLRAAALGTHLHGW